jgi:hypothetical protein
MVAIDLAGRGRSECGGELFRRRSQPCPGRADSGGAGPAGGGPAGGRARPGGGARPVLEHPGLGLAIVKAIVQGYGGTVLAANREGGGEVFEVRLPVQ